MELSNGWGSRPPEFFKSQCWARYTSKSPSEADGSAGTPVERSVFVEFTVTTAEPDPIAAVQQDLREFRAEFGPHFDTLVDVGDEALAGTRIDQQRPAGVVRFRISNLRVHVQVKGDDYTGQKDGADGSFSTTPTAGLRTAAEAIAKCLASDMKSVIPADK
ncbi:hypothetical protein [Nocardia sp. NPDC057440]|uniref:hypothetical protein n=1 Tax=Nocardia sp. NPDC057440 TaxID=3346134 RepID=UPI00367215EA